MGFVERVGREIHHLVEDLVRDRLRHAVCDRTDHAIRPMDEILALFCHHFVLFLAHCAAHEVASAIGIARQRAHDLHDLLLIDHAAVGGAEDRLQKRVQIRHAAGVVLALDIAGDLLHRARTVEGDACDEVLKAVRLELL